MKKLLLIITLCFLSFSVYAKNIDSVLGVSFGATKNDVIKTLKIKGWTAYKTEDSNIIQFIKDNGTYADIKVKNIHCSFYNNQLYKIKIEFVPKIWYMDVENSLDVIKNNYDLEIIQKSQGKLCDYITYKDNLDNYLYFLVNKIGEDYIYYFTYEWNEYKKSIVNHSENDIKSDL